MVRVIETVQDQEWHSWRKFKEEQHKYEQDLKEYNEWKSATKQREICVSQLYKGSNLVKSLLVPCKQQRFAF